MSGTYLIQLEAGKPIVGLCEPDNDGTWLVSGVFSICQKITSGLPPGLSVSGRTIVKTNVNLIIMHSGLLVGIR